MAIKNIIAGGIGFAPGSTRYLPTRGFLGALATTELLELRTAGNVFLALDGGSVTLDDFTANGGTTTVEFWIYNNGDVTLTLDYPPSISGDGSDAEPEAGGLAIAQFEHGSVLIAFDTAASGNGKSVNLSMTHDGDDSPFTITFNFNVVAAPGTPADKSRITRENRQRRHVRV